jgi:prepilin-type N-terminal cleavage/methylation domain-containing protein
VTRIPNSNKGFTLIEVMIVMVIMGIVTAQMFLVFSVQKRTFLEDMGAREVQEDARLITDLIVFDTRQAGFMVPNVAAVSSFDGQSTGPDQPDRFCVSDTSYFAIPDFGQASNDFDARAEPYGGEGVIAQSTFLTLNAGSNGDIDGDGNIDFLLPSVAFGTDGGGVIIANDAGTASYCARVAAWIPPNLFVEPQHQLTATALVALNLGGATAVPAVIYEVDEPNLTLFRNGMPLGTRVEDLQVEYWIDQSVAGTLGVMDAGEFPIHNLLNLPPGFVTDDITRVRISVVTRSATPDAQEGNQFAYHMRPAAGNRAEGPLDLFRRRRFTASVFPRNKL